MKTTVRRISRLVALPVFMALGASTLWAADENWFSREALGQLLVARTNAVVVYGKNATTGALEEKHRITLTGDNREIAFDIDLNAYVANVNGTTGCIAKILAIPPTTGSRVSCDAVQFSSALVDSSYNISTPAPRSVAIDRLQNLWVGLDNVKSLGGGKFLGVIQRYVKNSSGVYIRPTGEKTEYSVQSDGGGPLSLDVYVKENGTPVVYYTSRGSNVWVLDTTKPEVPQNPSQQNSSVVTTLSGSGTAAQLRILQPGKGEATLSSQPIGGGDIGGFLVAYTRSFKFITSAGGQRTCDFTDSLGEGQKQRTLVELDANPLYWWAADAGTGDWRKLDFTSTSNTSGCNQWDSLATGSPSGGGAVNGGLRVGPHLSFMTFPANAKTAKTAEFLDPTPSLTPPATPTLPADYAHAVRAIVNNTTNNQIRAAAWFVEVLSDGVCSPTPGDTENPFDLGDVDCRSVTNFFEGDVTKVPKAITDTSRTREHYVWIHEISALPSSPPQGFGINVSVIYFAEPVAEPVCPLSALNKPQFRATWLLDDFHPDLHQAAGGATPVVFNQFDANTLGAYFRDPTTSTGTKTTFNHYFIARGCMPFTGFFDPITNTQTTGSTLTLTFSIRDGANLFQTGLADFLNVTVAYKVNGQPVADRFGFSGRFLSGTGLLPVTEQSSVERYKINVYLDPNIFKLLPGETVTNFEFCVNALGGTTGVSEFCIDPPVAVKAGGKPGKK